MNFVALCRTRAAPCRIGCCRNRRGKGVVDQDRNIAGLRADIVQVQQLQGGIRRRLDHHQTGVGSKGMLDLLRADPGDLHAEQTVVQQVVGASVDRTDRHHMPLARGAHGEQTSGQRGHTRGERDGLFAALELGESFLEAGDRRVPQPAVDMAAAGDRPPTGRERLVGVAAGLDVGQRIGGGQVDRGHMDAETRQVTSTGMHCTSLEGVHEAS